MTPISGNKLKRNFLFYLIGITIIAGLAGSWLIHSYFPNFYFPAYPFIPAYFLLFGILYMNILVSAHRKSSQRYLTAFISARMMKLIVSILLIVVYGLLVKEQFKEFIFTFICFYLLYLVFETMFFVSCQKNK